MKIAYLSTFYPFRGGIAQFNAALYRAFESQNYTIKAYNFSRQYPDILFPGKTQYVTDNDISDKIPNQAILDTINPISYFKTAKLINQYNPDMLITKFWMPFFAPSLGKVARSLRKNGTKNIAILDNVIPHEKRLGDTQLINYFTNSYDGFVVMSKQVESDLLSIKPNAKYISHLHPLYDHFPAALSKNEARQKLGIPDDKKLLLYFGFIRDYKGLDLLLESISMLDDSYHLLICGEVYGSFDKYDQMIEKLNIAHKVSKHVRYIDDNEVSLFFSAADVNMLTYKTATQSGITAIAFHYNLPVIVTDVGGLKEVVEPYGTGLVVAKPKVDLIIESVIQFFQLKESKPEYFEESLISFKKKSSWISLSKTISDFYNSL